METARAITKKMVPPPASLLNVTAVSWIGLGLVAVALIHAVREYRLARRGASGAWRGVLPLGVLATGFAAIIAGWK